MARRRRPGTGRRGSRSRRLSTGPRSSRGAAAAAAADHGLDPGHHLLRMRGLGDPVVGAEAQAAHALGDGRTLGADDDRRGRAASRRPARGTPSRAGRAPRGRRASAFSFIATSSSAGTLAPWTRYSQPAASKRRVSTRRKPLSLSITARRTVPCCGVHRLHAPDSSTRARRIVECVVDAVGDCGSQDFHTQILGFFTGIAASGTRLAAQRDPLSCSARLSPCPEPRAFYWALDCGRAGDARSPTRPSTITPSATR